MLKYCNAIALVRISLSKDNVITFLIVEFPLQEEMSRTCLTTSFSCIVAVHC